jgi:hypothetical protein
MRLAVREVAQGPGLAAPESWQPVGGVAEAWLARLRLDDNSRGHASHICRKQISPVGDATKLTCCSDRGIVRAPLHCTVMGLHTPGSGPRNSKAVPARPSMSFGSRGPRSTCGPAIVWKRDRELGAATSGRLPRTPGPRPISQTRQTHRLASPNHHLLPCKAPRRERTLYRQELLIGRTIYEHRHADVISLTPWNLPCCQIK